MLLQPPDRRGSVHLAQVHHQVDGPATALMVMPVEKPGTCDGKRTTRAAPLPSVAAVTFGAPVPQHRC